MKMDLTTEELAGRLRRFSALLDAAEPAWDTVLILSKVNQYYFTGTMQDGILVIPKNGEAKYFVRRSYERARAESPLPFIFPIASYREAASAAGPECGNTFLETEIVTLSLLERLQKYFQMTKIKAVDRFVLTARAVKTPYELACLTASGRRLQHILQETAPALLREGMSEADFGAELFREMIREGHHGLCRFAMFQTEMVVGQIGFGESSLYPTAFDGPGGARGLSPAAPVLGSRDRKLRKGDLVFVDIGFGLNGYHTDKTQVYLFGGKPAPAMKKAHQACIDVQSRTAELLRPGAVPSEIYRAVMTALPADFKQNFMGFQDRMVRFLGHGVGLQVDEPPVIAEGDPEPLAANMAIALEPKKGLAASGMVGVEDTYIVTPDGGKCLTGGGCKIIEI
jgi:Xaa-Pro dipeptidase